MTDLGPLGKILFHYDSVRGLLPRLYTPKPNEDTPSPEKLAEMRLDNFSGSRKS